MALGSINYKGGENEVALADGVANAYFKSSAEMRMPSKWAKLHLGARLTRDQRRIARSVRDNRYTAVPSCHDSGKSYDAAVITSWWLETHPVGEAFATTTAPTGPQVSAILWREIERMHRSAGLRGRITMGTQPGWKVGKELIAYGRKPADYGAVGFQGIHTRYPLIVVDEACGIPKPLWDAIDSLATNRNARVLAIGNPDDSASHFHSICQPGSGWNVIHLDGLLQPNFTEASIKQFPDLYQYFIDNMLPFSTEPVPTRVREVLLSVEWVAERMQRWGVSKDPQSGLWSTSALWEAKVRGRFPKDSTEGAVPLAWIEAANRRWVEFVSNGGDFNQIPGRRTFNCDVARFGDDETTIATRQGNAIIERVERIGNQDTMTTANRLAAKIRQNAASAASVDVIGIGAGVVDRLRELKLPVTPFNASERTDMTDPSGEFTFPNVRSAAWWNLRELLNPARGSNVMLPPDEELTVDLTAPRWEIRPGAKIAIEPKDQIKKRIGRSPDRGDAVVIAFWPETYMAPGSAFATAQYNEQAQHRNAREYAAGASNWEGWGAA